MSVGCRRVRGWALGEGPKTKRQPPQPETSPRRVEGKPADLSSQLGARDLWLQMKGGCRGIEDCAAGDSDDCKGAEGDGTHDAAAAHRASGRKLLSALQGVGENPTQEAAAKSDEQRDELLELRDPSGPARWAARRACGSGLGVLAKPGRAKGTRDALAAAHTLTCVCCTPGCAALVDLQAARREARAAGRSAFEPGDGCSGRSCCAPAFSAAGFRTDSGGWLQR